MDEQIKLCVMHQRLDDIGKLACEITNGCVACSLHERKHLLEIMADFARTGDDSVTCLMRLCNATRREDALEQHIRNLVMVVKNDVKWISTHGGAENPMSLAIVQWAEEALAYKGDKSDAADSGQEGE